MTDEEIDEQEVIDIMREVFRRLARQVEYAVDHGMEIRKMTDEELEAAGRGEKIE